MIKHLQGKKNIYHFQRFEWKYKLPIQICDGILSDILPYMNWDPHVSEKNDYTYQVNSIYFDSHDYRLFFEKMDGLKERKKLRLRWYDHLTENSLIYIEIKHKIDAFIIKDRVPIENSLLKYYMQKSFSLYTKIFDKLATDYHRIIKEFLYTTAKYCLNPKLYVSYLRRPLIAKGNSHFRVTFDQNISTSSINNITNPEKLKLVDPEYTILEIKYKNSLPGWFYHIIQKYKLQPEPYSKYCNSLIQYMPSSKYIFHLNNE